MSRTEMRVPIVAKYIRWGFALTAVIFVAVRLGTFIGAVTTDVSLIEIKVRVDLADGAKLLSPSTSVTSIAEAEQMPNVRAYTVKRGDFLWANAILEPAFADLPRDLRDRLRLASFSVIGDGVQVRPLETFYVQECKIKASDVGTYYIIAYLPPISISTKKSESVNIGKFMRQNEGAKCVAVRIIVQESSDKSNKPTKVWEESNLPLLNLCQPNKRNELEMVSVMMSQTLPTPVPHAQLKSTKRDMSERKDGVKNGSDDQTVDSDNVEENSNPVVEVKRVPPERIAKREKIFTPGTLPEIDIVGNLSEIMSLNLQEWNSICKNYDMRFVCSTNSMAGEFIVMALDGSKSIMDYEYIRKHYGGTLFSLTNLSNVVASNAKELFNDPKEWDVCEDWRGFLINNLLLQAIDDVVQDYGLTKTDFQKIKKVRVCLRVVEKQLGKTIDVDVLDVVLNEDVLGPVQKVRDE